MENIYIYISILNLAFILFGYLYFYPKKVKNDADKLVEYDKIFSLSALYLSILIYFFLGINFSLNNFAKFVFISIGIYFLIETPFFFYYLKKFKISFKEIIGKK